MTSPVELLWTCVSSMLMKTHLHPIGLHCSECHGLERHVVCGSVLFDDMGNKHCDAWIDRHMVQLVSQASLKRGAHMLTSLMPINDDC